MAGIVISDTIQSLSGASTSTTNVINGWAKAWVLYNASTQTVSASFNVSSVTNNGSNFTLNFTTALSDANYVVAGTINGVSGSSYPGGIGPFTASLLTTTSATVQTFCMTPPFTAIVNINAVLNSVVIFD